jgi:hypothetical protein
VADQDTSEREEALMDVSASVESYTQSPLRVEPGDGPFHRPSFHTQSAAVNLSAAGGCLRDDGRDSADPEQPAVEA